MGNDVLWERICKKNEYKMQPRGERIKKLIRKIEDTTEHKEIESYGGEMLNIVIVEELDQVYLMMKFFVENLNENQELKSCIIVNVDM